MRYLLDSEILNWNRRLEKTPYMVYPKSNHQGSNPHISFRQKTLGDLITETIDPHLNNYQFVFSVAKNRVDNFFDIYNTLKEEDFNTSNYVPGGKGNSKLYKDLKEQSGL